jgi:hypothetical protein
MVSLYQSFFFSQKKKIFLYKCKCTPYRKKTLRFTVFFLQTKKFLPRYLSTAFLEDYKEWARADVCIGVHCERGGIIREIIPLESGSSRQLAGTR